MRKVTKKNIRMALGVGETWLSQAELGSRLLEEYKDNEGVKAKLGNPSANSSKGSGQLLEYLKDLNRE